MKHDVIFLKRNAINSKTQGRYILSIKSREGYANASIHDSWARCALSGGDVIGGAAGYGKEVVNCTTMVEITEGESCLGALCGTVADDDTTLEGNRIVSDSGYFTVCLARRFVLFSPTR